MPDGVLIIPLKSCYSSMNINSNYQKIILLSLGFFVLLMVMAVFHENGILNAYRFEQEQVKIKKENEELRLHNDLLRQNILALKSDPYAIEKVAREKLNLAKPGDQVYRIVSTPVSYTHLTLPTKRIV